MECILPAYCLSQPLLLLLSFSSHQRLRNAAHNLLAVSNLALIGYTVFLNRQVYALYLLGKQLHMQLISWKDYFSPALFMVGLCMTLPSLALFYRIRGSRVYTALMLALLYLTFPPFSWNITGAAMKTAYYACVLCSVYALLWLLKMLPNQSRKQTCILPSS